MRTTTHHQPFVDAFGVEFVKALQYSQPVAVFVFAYADVALRPRLAVLQFRHGEQLRRQLSYVTRLEPTRYGVTDPFHDAQQMLSKENSPNNWTRKGQRTFQIDLLRQTSVQAIAQTDSPARYLDQVDLNNRRFQIAAVHLQ
jgi:hypothetical protein